MDTPRTIQLNSAEWASLACFCVSGLGNIMSSIAQGTEGARLSDDNARSFLMGLERASSLIEAWRRSSQISREPPQQHAENGQAAPKKPGWPKGKKRTKQQIPPDTPH